MQRKSIIGSIFRWILLLFGLIPVVLLVYVAVLAFIDHATAPVLRTELTVEAGTASVDPARFLTSSEDPYPTYLAGISQAQLSTPGSYPVTLNCDGRHYEATIHVVDTVAPAAQVTDLTSLGDMPEASDFILSTEDATEVSIAYQSLPDMTLNGSQTVTILLTDTSGNRTSVEATLTLDLDLEAPQIHGVQSFLVYQGDTIAYRNGISLTDNRDESPVLSIDSTRVNLSEPGEYTLIYYATDAAGNSASAETTVTVKEKQPGFAELETIYAEVDAVLEQIIKEDMTTRQQARAIYNWVRSNCGYVNHSDKTDYFQGAYVMLTERKGDCFNYFSLCKLMFERLGIPNIDVRKVKNYESDSDHYWSLVSVDGGETWYHFDSVPRGEPDAIFFLVTDAYMDAYSVKHNNCFNRDTSLYPATPEQ